MQEAAARRIAKAYNRISADFVRTEIGCIDLDALNAVFTTAGVAYTTKGTPMAQLLLVFRGG